MDSLQDFTSFQFDDDKFSHRVYRKGIGPAVVVIHEMPGITPKVADFSRRVVDRGFTVFMPSLFGTDGQEPTQGRFLKEFAKLCVSREFSLLARNRASPVTDWLRALASRAFEEIGGRGVGAIGMCITGNFALTMALDPHLMAPVLSQPSLPWNPLGIGAGAVHCAPNTLATIRSRHVEDGLTVIGLRFDSDKLCRPARFETLKDKLAEAFDGRQLPDACAANFAKGERHPHSVLTKELIDRPGERTHKELEDVLAFFERRLR